MHNSLRKNIINVRKFVVSNRDLQVKLKEIREKVNKGDDAIHHSRGSDDLVITSLKRYNQMIDILFKEHKSAKEVLEEEQDNKKLLEKYVALSMRLQEENLKEGPDFVKQKDLSNEWSKIKKEILKRMKLRILG